MMLITELNQIKKGEYAKVTWIERLPYEKTMYFIGRLREVDSKGMTFEVFLDSENKDHYTEIEELLHEDVLNQLIPTITIPLMAFNHFDMSKEERSNLIKNKHPLVYVKMEKMKKSDIILLSL